MRNPDQDVFRSCDPAGALPGWSLGFVASAQGLPGEVFDRPNHAYTTIEFIEAGWGAVEIGGRRRHRLGPGDAFILPEGVDHRICCDDDEPWRVLFLNCTGDLPPQLATAYGLADRYVFPGAAVAPPLRHLLSFRGADAELQLAAGPALHDIYARLHASINVDPDWPEFVVRAKVFMDANPGADTRLADVAAHVGYSTAHVSRAVRSHVGQSPGDYLLSRRMDLAKGLLDSTAEPIKSIAGRLGYNDAFAFSHAFKSSIGMSPSQWRAGRLGG